MRLNAGTDVREWTGWTLVEEECAHTPCPLCRAEEKTACEDQEREGPLRGYFAFERGY